MDTLNEQQLYATTFNGKHLLVLAGAGTGKTRTIIARAKHLIESGVMAPQLERRYAKDDSWKWRKEDFPILQEVAKKTGSISEFVAEYILDPKLETSWKEGGKIEDTVILSTIHSAKGLEASMTRLLLRLIIYQQLMLKLVR